jgi:hypothetical protein
VAAVLSGRSGCAWNVPDAESMALLDAGQGEDNEIENNAEEVGPLNAA